MAFIELDNENPTGNPSFYNVTTAVGHGCKNMEEDVKVVQFFLTRVYQTEPFKDLKPKGAMTIDGKVGPITRNWILKFQLDMRNRGNAVLADGIIDKAGNENNPDNFTSSISNTNYTIRYMNNVLRKKDTAVYKTLTSNAAVPPDMRMIFMQINAQGPAMNYGSD
jgi:hypothetical protein